MRKTQKQQRMISSLYPGEGLILANAFGALYAREILKTLAPVLPVTSMSAAEFDRAMNSCQITFSPRR